MNYVSVGQKVRFDILEGIKRNEEKRPAYAVGTVVYLNVPHGWFSVQYGNGQRASFKFTDIGKTVTLCK